MSDELDGVCARVDCRKCGAIINVPLQQLRLRKAAGCRCGALIRFEKPTPISAIERIIAQLKRPIPVNDRA